MQAKHMQFYKIGLWVVFIKLGQKHASKDGIELAVFKAFWDGPVLRARGRGTGPRSPAHSTARQWVLLRLLHGLQRTQTGTQLKHRK